MFLIHICLSTNKWRIPHPRPASELHATLAVFIFSEHSICFLFHQGILYVTWHIYNVLFFSAPNVQTTIMQVAQVDAAASSSCTAMMVPLSLEEREILYHANMQSVLVYFIQKSNYILHLTHTSCKLAMILFAFLHSQVANVKLGLPKKTILTLSRWQKKQRQ